MRANSRVKVPSRTGTHAEHNLNRSGSRKNEHFGSIYNLSRSLDRSVFNPGYPAYPKTLGEWLRKTRLDIGLQIKEVAQHTGIHEMSIINWELKDVKPRDDLLSRLMGYYEEYR